MTGDAPELSEVAAQPGVWELEWIPIPGEPRPISLPAADFAGRWVEPWEGVVPRDGHWLPSNETLHRLTLNQLKDIARKEGIPDLGTEGIPAPRSKGELQDAIISWRAASDDRAMAFYELVLSVGRPDPLGHISPLAYVPQQAASYVAKGHTAAVVKGFVTACFHAECGQMEKAERLEKVGAAVAVLDALVRQVPEVCAALCAHWLPAVVCNLFCFLRQHWPEQRMNDLFTCWWYSAELAPLARILENWPLQCTPQYPSEVGVRVDHAISRQQAEDQQQARQLQTVALVLEKLFAPGANYDVFIVLRQLAAQQGGAPRLLAHLVARLLHVVQKHRQLHGQLSERATAALQVAESTIVDGVRPLWLSYEQRARLHFELSDWAAAAQAATLALDLLRESAPPAHADTTRIAELANMATFRRWEETEQEMPTDPEKKLQWLKDFALGKYINGVNVRDYDFRIAQLESDPAEKAEALARCAYSTLRAASDMLETGLQQERENNQALLERLNHTVAQESFGSKLPPHHLAAALPTWELVLARAEEAIALSERCEKAWLCKVQALTWLRGAAVADEALQHTRTLQPHRADCHELREHTEQVVEWQKQRVAWEQHQQQQQQQQQGPVRGVMC